MIRRLWTLGRRALGLGLWAWSAWQLLRALVQRRRDPVTVATGIGAHGELYRLRVAPLSRAETARARALERQELEAAWSRELERQELERQGETY